MVLSGMYSTPDPQESRAALRHALDAGITLLDTANAYSAGANETFLGEELGDRRRDVVLATKFGLRRETSGIVVDSSPKHAMESIDESLRRLRTDHVDLYYVHRLSVDIPVEETVGAMASMVDAGKVRFLGLCEVSGSELERAHAVHPITAVQSEWSLWAREIENDTVPAARRLGVGIVPYGPLGRGFFAGAIPAAGALESTDVRSTDPRFAPENIEHNLRLLTVLDDLARAKGCTKAQIALAWLKAQGSDVVPIPGSEKREFLDDNIGALDVLLGVDDLILLDRTFPVGVAKGNADRVHLRSPRPDPRSVPRSDHPIDRAADHAADGPGDHSSVTT
jgi:aryl-alcohol dehydrogenase-like predicted oxidoreductase